MALPIVEQASKEKKFKSLDDIFSRENAKIEVVLDEQVDLDIFAEEYSQTIDVHRLTNIPGLKEQLGHVCDIQGKVKKKSECLLLSWLTRNFRNCD